LSLSEVLCDDGHRLVRGRDIHGSQDVTNVLQLVKLLSSTHGGALHRKNVRREGHEGADVGDLQIVPRIRGSGQDAADGFVDAGSIDFQDRVRDPARDFYLMDAQVLMRGRDPIWTDTHGRFDLVDVPEGVPVNVTIRSFGYLPIDTTFTPDDEERYTFDLTRDALAEAMIDMQIRRIDDHARGRLTTFREGFMDRERVLDYAGSHTASSMLQFEYPQRILDWIACTFIDDRPTDGSYGALGAEVAAATLAQTVPEEIERVELSEFPGAEGRPLILHIYTRSFIMAMTTQSIPLRTPTINPRGQCS
jgi:hypothetical protein